MEIKSRTKFCHYTSVDNARNILDSECFFLNKYDAMNDCAEARSHNEDINRVFVLSFSHSEAANIPIYYLYGGIDGKGCRIQFTDAKIRSILKTCTISYVNKHGKRIKGTVSSSEYEILADWVYYISANGYCEHKNDDAIQYNGYDAAKDKLRQNNRHLCIKNPIWKFENEFRIVVIFKEEVQYPKVALHFPISNEDRGISVRFGPETTSKEYLALVPEFMEYGVSNCDRLPEDRISMNLVNRNKGLYKNAQV